MTFKQTAKAKHRAHINYDFIIHFRRFSMRLYRGIRKLSSLFLFRLPLTFCVFVFCCYLLLPERLNATTQHSTAHQNITVCLCPKRSCWRFDKIVNEKRVNTLDPMKEKNEAHKKGKISFYTTHSPYHH